MPIPGKPLRVDVLWDHTNERDALDEILRQAVKDFPDPIKVANGLPNLFAALRAWSADGGDSHSSVDRNLLATWRGMTEEQSDERNVLEEGA